MGRILAGGAARQLGEAVGGVAEVFVGNRAEREAAVEARLGAAVEQFGGEFAAPGASRFDGFVNALNRVPRPALALGTLGLFVYAMAEPGGFALRMQGLALVPEPLWWLLGAIVSFYFGARELHYQRSRPGPAPAPRAAVAPLARPAALAAPAPATAEPAAASIGPDANAAVEEWRRLRA